MKHLIPIYYNGNYGQDGYREVVDSASGVATVVNAQTIDTYIKKQTLNNYYYRSDLLLQFLRNVDSVTNNNFINHNLHIYIWLSFTLAVIIFSIRITNIRNFIFSTITGGLIAILISIIVFFIGFNGVNQDLYIYVFIACLYLLIASVPIVFMKPGRKLFYSILMTITISCFAPFLYLLVMIAGKVLKDKNGYPVDYFLLSFSDSTISITIFLLSILFLFFYMGIVKKWKALPE